MVFCAFRFVVLLVSFASVPVQARPRAYVRMCVCAYVNTALFGLYGFIFVVCVFLYIFCRLWLYMALCGFLMCVCVYVFA